MGIIERKEREKEQRRNNILDAAEKVFFKLGFDNATMDDVAEMAELSKGTIYLYFSSKEDLYYAISIRALQVLRQSFEINVPDDAPVLDKILAIGKAFVQFAREKTDYFKTLIYFTSLPDCHNAHERYTKLCEEKADPMSFFIQILQQGIDEGKLRPDIPALQLAHILWTQTTGILNLAATKNIHYDLNNCSEDEIINNHIEIIKNGILKRE
jgi:AcrR family transcriptional regulator